MPNKWYVAKLFYRLEHQKNWEDLNSFFFFFFLSIPALRHAWEEDL